MTNNIFDTKVNNLYSDILKLNNGLMLMAVYEKSGCVRLYVNGKATTIKTGKHGGYDRCGTVFANFICLEYQDLLKEKYEEIKGFINVSKNKDSIYIDGGCGDEDLKRVLQVLNLI